KMTKSDMKHIKDNEGNILYDVVEPLSQDMHGKAALFERNQIKAFLELHIEQGPILEKNNKDIGIVTDIAALMFQVKYPRCHESFWFYPYAYEN
ncbi:hypothetical protein J4710_03950, partial [Staphylococcus xylosus]|nr:hypothetical protein [Staphylococcus xylosus]